MITDDTPIWDQMIAEKPDTLDIPCSVALSYEEVVQHATTPVLLPSEDISFPTEWKQPGLKLED